MRRLLKIHNPVVLGFFVLLCNNYHRSSGDIKTESNCDHLKAGQQGYIQLTNSHEPGNPLIIYGKIINGKTRKPVSDAALFVYQTDSSGIYNSTGPDENARIKGTVNTNANGCFKIKTILPGDYPGRMNSRHLHYVIRAKGYQEKKSILFFKGFTTENVNGRGPLTVLDIKKDKTGTWIGSTDLQIESADQ